MKNKKDEKKCLPSFNPSKNLLKSVPKYQRN